MTDYFDLIKTRKPSQSQTQDQRRRQNHQPAISDAQATGDAARQKADEAHNRVTNPAVDAAHAKAEAADTNANTRIPATTGAVDYNLLGAGVVYGEKMTPNSVGAEANVGATSFLDYNHALGVIPRIIIAEAQTEFGWAPLAYAGQLFLDHCNATHIRIWNNTSSTWRVRMRLWR